MSEIARFGRCELRFDERMLRIDGVAVPVGSRAFDVLCALVRQRHRVLTKAELLDLAWPGLVVEENNLSVQVSTLRKLLGGSAISTVPGIGYRFTLAVEAPPAPPRHSRPMPPEADTLEATLAATLQHEQVVLYARLAAAATQAEQPSTGQDWWRTRLVPLACQHLDAWEGHLLSCDDEGLAAAFSSARTAIACARNLHLFSARDGRQLGVGVHRGDPAPCTDSTAAARLLALSGQAGETTLSADAAAQVIRQLDGELLQEGTEDGPSPPDTPQRFRYRTMPAEAVVPTPSWPAHDLRPTLAVIPFRGYASEPGPFALGDVLADQVIAALSRSHAIRVISRLSTAAFRANDTSVAEVASRLSSHYVVSGRYLHQGDRVQLRLELAQAPQGDVVWAHSLEDSVHAALQLDSTLVQAIVLGISQALHAHQLRTFRSQPLPTLASHTLLLAAISLLYRLSQRDFDMAHQALLALRERAPRHAEPLAWLARWHLFRVVQGWADDPRQEGQLALDCANAALDLDPDSSLALTMLGNVHTNHLRDLDGAQALYEQALSLNPNESLAWLQKGNACAFSGDGAAALDHVGKAVSLSPLDPSRHHYLTILAGSALTAGDHARAIAAAREALQHNRGHVSTHRVLAIALAMSGQLDDARRSVQTLMRLEPHFTVAGFIARSPGARSGLAATFGQALLDAGAPPGDAAAR